MGLDYYIRSYIKKENLIPCLEWLNVNTEGRDNVFVLRGEKISIKGNRLVVNGKETTNQTIEIDKLNRIEFDTSLIFYIDSEIVRSMEDPYLGVERVEENNKRFVNSYLGNGEIKIDGFSIYIELHDDLYAITIAAGTSNTSVMLEKSISVRKWIFEFSEFSNAIFL